mmetsp:Transcript_36238/g.91213  ORF Transcript_36238/g.91213 Transcript_36238/m.91213 type:complete len:256 (+) Transcript_36238:63-830(+)
MARLQACINRVSRALHLDPNSHRAGPGNQQNFDSGTRSQTRLAWEQKRRGGKDRCLKLPAALPPFRLPARPRRSSRALVPHAILNIPTLLAGGGPCRWQLECSCACLHAARAAPPSTGALRLVLGLHLELCACYRQEQLERQKGVAPCCVSQTTALQAVLAGQAVKRSVRKFIPKLVAARAIGRERDIKASKVLGELLSGKHPQEVAKVVETREGNPPWCASMPTNEIRSCQALAQNRSLDTLRRVAWEVNASGA